jgi:hypothetical protein
MTAHAVPARVLFSSLLAVRSISAHTRAPARRRSPRARASPPPQPRRRPRSSPGSCFRRWCPRLGYATPNTPAPARWRYPRARASPLSQPRRRRRSQPLPQLPPLRRSPPSPRRRRLMSITLRRLRQLSLPYIRHCLNHPYRPPVPGEAGRALPEPTIIMNTSMCVM